MKNKKEMINSFRIKAKVVRWLLWHRGYQIAVTEGFNQSDVFAVKRTGYTTEIEIKLSRSDLRRELNSIKAVMENLNPNDYNCKKYHKHKAYLKPDRDFADGKFKRDYRSYFDSIPNEFVFLVPESMSGFAEVYLRNTPYGIWYFVLGESFWGDEIEVIKRPIKLHLDKIKLSDSLRLARKASTECQMLRTKIIEREENIKEKLKEVRYEQ